MSERRTFTVETVGVGRPDYSQNVEYSTEPIIRSHLMRFVQSSYLAFFTPPFPGYYRMLLYFLDKAGNILLYAPDDVEYMIYDVLVGGDYNALTIATIEKFRLVDLGPPLDIVWMETIAKVYGYGKVNISLTKGHKCEQGMMYLIGATQWSENLIFDISYTIHGMTDQVISG